MGKWPRGACPPEGCPLFRSRRPLSWEQAPHPVCHHCRGSGSAVSSVDGATPLEGLRPVGCDLASTLPQGIFLKYRFDLPAALLESFPGSPCLQGKIRSLSPQSNLIWSYSISTHFAQVPNHLQPWALHMRFPLQGRPQHFPLSLYYLICLHHSEKDHLLTIALSQLPKTGQALWSKLVLNLSSTMYSCGTLVNPLHLCKPQWTHL